MSRIILCILALALLLTACQPLPSGGYTPGSSDLPDWRSPYPPLPVPDEVTA